MNDLAERGFLSPELSTVVSVVRERYAPWIQLIDEINVFSVHTQHGIEIHKSCLQQFLVATLFSRTLSNVQGGLLLTERGMDIQARILLRAAMDSLFSLMAIAKSPEVAQEFEAADEVERKRKLHKARRWNALSLKEQAQALATNEKLAEIKSAILEKGAKAISSEEMSKKAGLHDWYLTAYSDLSASVHSSIRDLESHVLLDEDGEIQSLKNEATIDGLDALYLTSADIMLMALRGLGVVFPVNVNEFCAEKFSVLGDLAKMSGG